MTEQELVRAAAGGDTEAFARLVRTYENKIYSLAFRMCGSADDASDIAQEAFLAAWRGLPSFRGDSGFATWLYRLTSNAAIDYLRRQKKQRGDMSLDDEELGLDAVDTGPGPQDAAERTEVRSVVAAGRQELSEGHRQVLVLPGDPGPQLRGDCRRAGGGSGNGKIPDFPGPIGPAQNFAAKRELIRLSAV